MLPATRRSGLVRMDQFEAQATWDNAAGESIVVRFQGDLLSKQKRNELTHFRSRTRALFLRVPGCQERQASIVGYNVPENSFYLTWLTTERETRCKSKQRNEPR